MYLTKAAKEVEVLSNALTMNVWDESFIWSEEKIGENIFVCSSNKLPVSPQPASLRPVTLVPSELVSRTLGMERLQTPQYLANRNHGRNSNQKNAISVIFEVAKLTVGMRLEALRSTARLRKAPRCHTANFPEAFYFKAMFSTQFLSAQTIFSLLRIHRHSQEVQRRTI